MNTNILQLASFLYCTGTNTSVSYQKKKKQLYQADMHYLEIASLLEGLVSM